MWFDFGFWNVFLLLFPFMIFVSIRISGAYTKEEACFVEEVKHDQRPPVLLLRSFSDLSLKQGTGIRGNRDSASVPPVSYLHELSAALAPFGRTVILSKEDEGQSPGNSLKERFRLKPLCIKVSDEDWEEWFHLASRHSSVIFMFPSLTQGVVTEVSHIMQNPGLLSKTLILMPPSNHDEIKNPFVSQAFKMFSAVTGIQWEDHASAWQCIKTDLAVKGFHLPLYETSGMLYLPNSDLSVRQSVSFLDRKFSRSSVSQAFTCIQPSLSTTGTQPLSSLAEHLHHVSSTTFKGKPLCREQSIDSSA